MPPAAPRTRSAVAIAATLAAACASADVRAPDVLVEELPFVRVPYVEEPGEVQTTLRSRWGSDREGLLDDAGETVATLAITMEF